MAKRKEVDAAELVKRYEKARAAGKRAYERADKLVLQIAGLVDAGEAIPLGGSGRKAVLVDKWDGKTIVWTPCGARRYEVQIIES